MLHLIQSNKMELLLASLLKTLAEQTFQETEQTFQGEHSFQEKQQPPLTGDDLSLNSLLAPDTVLVQSPGMSQWLKINIAQTLNIAANIEFPLPSSYIWRLYDKSIEGLPKESTFNKNHLSWKILQLLPRLVNRPEFANIKQYLYKDAHVGADIDINEGLPEQLKAWQLSTKIADVYDQYLMYRPDWIKGWMQGLDTAQGIDVSIQPWQPELWRQLVAYSETLGESPWHRANMHDALIEQLTNNPVISSQPLYVFGISAMPVQQLEVLQAIAIHRDVFIYWFNPSHHFWADVIDTRQYKKQQLSLFDEPASKQQKSKQQKSKQQKSEQQKSEQEAFDLQSKQADAFSLLDVGNPLLASWGKPGQEFLSMLSELDIEQYDIFESPKVDTMLSWVQKEIYDLSFRNSRKPLGAKDLLKNTGKFAKNLIEHGDHSVEIHAVHSKLRELEVLKDQICHWFEIGQIESVGDIIVMMPDVASYAPLIDAVFSRPLHYRDDIHDIKAIPFAISDRTQAQEDTLVQSFLRLMDLEYSRLTLTDIFELIKVPEIGVRYQLSMDELDILFHWCSQAGIRWGWSGADKKNWNIPEEQQNTWLFGLQRLLSGYAYNGDTFSSETFQDEHVLPFEEVEGQNTQALGRFLGFLEDLQHLVEFCRHSHVLSIKVEEALLVIDCFYEVDNDNEYRIQKLKESVAELKQHKFQYDGTISQQVFVSALKERLNQRGVGQRFLAGKLNFCTLMPMRSIPFKHVCILGLNETDYPRQTVPISFDLMTASTVRKGDRSRRLDDRYLFLEALLSARQKLYLSYIGRSDRNNELREPSILVSEFIDYCQQSVCFEEHQDLSVEQSEAAVRKHLVHAHPLQPWSESYFKDSALLSDEKPLAYDKSPADDKSLSYNKLFSYDKSMLALAQNQGMAECPSFLTLDLQKIHSLFSHAANGVDNESLVLPEISEALTELPDTIELDRLMQFLRNPVKSWFKSNWKTQFPSLIKSDIDQEPLSLDALERYKATQSMLFGEDTDKIVNDMRNAGVLPIAKLKDIELEALYARVNHIKEKLLDAVGTVPSALQMTWVDCEVPIAGINIVISAPLTLIAEKQLLLFRPGKLSGNDRLQTWLSWCVLCGRKSSAGQSGAGQSGASMSDTSQSREGQYNKQAWFLAEDKTLQLPEISQSEAQAHLRQILYMYLFGQKQCLPFFPATSLSWVEHQDSEKAIKTYLGSDFIRGDGQEVHNQRIYPVLTDVWQPFTSIAEAVFVPILKLESVSR